MKTVSMWMCMANCDRTEGRGPMQPSGIAFTEKEDAIKCVRTKTWGNKYGVQGCPGSAYDVKEVSIVIYDDFREWGHQYHESGIDQEKQDALAKLTDHEKKILGL